MTTTETRRYEMLLRVREFGAMHRDRFPAGGPARDAFDEVAAVVAELGEQAVSKMSAARGGKSAKEMARRALTERLRAISHCARVIAETTPGFDDPFQLPNARTELSILTAGRVFLREAERSASRFAELGMPDTLVANLKVLVDEFDQAIRTAHAGRESHLAARAGIGQAVSAGLAAVRRLDVIVANQLHDDPVTIAVWQRDRRVDYRSRTRRAAATPQEAPVSAS